MKRKQSFYTFYSWPLYLLNLSLFSLSCKGRAGIVLVISCCKTNHPNLGLRMTFYDYFSHFCGLTWVIWLFSVGVSHVVTVSSWSRSHLKAQLGWMSWWLSYLFSYYLWLRWVFVAARGFSLAAASRIYPSLRCTDFSLWWLLSSLVVLHFGQAVSSNLHYRST